MNRVLWIGAVFTAIVCASLLVAQRPTERQASAESPANPEMARLAKALLGDWSTSETMEPGEFFPSGGFRRGKVHVRLAAGGNALLYEVHSNGSAGPLDGFLTIWWNKGSQLYYFFGCFSSPDRPCQARGTAHWEGEAFVNDYEENVGGKDTQWRDTFTFMPASHTVVAAIKLGDGTMKTLITTRATRR